jgi:membrane dipeptidase
MIVDVSHISDEAFWDMIKITERPIIASHSNSRAVCDESRNLTDDMFRAIMETGGVAGLNLYTEFIGEDANLDRACDHILHWLELDPDGEHIALGGDLDGCEELPVGFDGVQSYPALAQRLLDRGVDKNTLHRIFWENALGVMEKCCM